ncbi:MAG: hypothetical protein J5600_06200, partial [Desulfovibrio sp.]|nr:hypothetical protein [Desulfovibrio sp.]
HDLILGQTAGRAGLHWQSPGIKAQNPTLPGCGLTFELWRRPDGSQYVASRVLANDLATLHTRELHESDGRLKPVKIMALDVMDDEGRLFAMDASDFETSMLARVRRECVAPEPHELLLRYPESGDAGKAAAGKDADEDSDESFSLPKETDQP